INIKEITPIYLNLKVEIKSSKVPIRNKKQTLRKYNEEDKQVIKEI
ncbi:11835_t:CDS:1, partial [Cetraspora pellucida]